MDKKVFKAESDYLDGVEKQIDKSKNLCQKKIKENQNSIQELKQYFSSNYYEIRTGNGEEYVGEDELANINITIEALEKQNDSLKTDIAKLSKQKNIPYFGRFDFKPDDSDQKGSFYIGLGHINNEENQNLVLDWRADICSLYYDNKFGKTAYACENGKISGDLSLKRQYRIRDGKLKYYIDSKMLIDDEKLSEEQMGELIKIHHTLENMSRLNRSLLFLCKIDNNQFGDEKLVSFNEIFARLIDDFCEVHSPMNIKTDVTAEGEFAMRMNETLASALVTNLFKNAFAHNVSGGFISVVIAPESFVISNSGAQKPLDKSKIFTRFYHSGGKKDSSGLGLAIAQAICRHYNLLLEYSFRNGAHVFSVRR